MFCVIRIRRGPFVLAFDGGVRRWRGMTMYTAEQLSGVVADACTCGGAYPISRDTMGVAYDTVDVESPDE